MQKNGLTKILVSLLCFVLLLIGIEQCAKSPTDPRTSPVPSNAATSMPSGEPISTPFDAYRGIGYTPAPVDNITGFTTGWFAQTTDGAIYLNNTYNTMEVTIDAVGTSMDASEIYRDGIPLEQGHTYVIACVGFASINRSIQLALEDANTSSIYTSSTLALTPEATPLSFQFTMSSASNWNGRLAILLGNDGNAESQSSHSVTLQEVRIADITGVSGHDIRVNQVGYLTEGQKRCVFPYDAGDFFDVLDASTQTIIYTGAIVNEMVDEKTGETNYYGDFSSVTIPGNYIVRSQIGVISEVFPISSTDGLLGIFGSLQKMLSLQRCGENLEASWAQDLSHLSCHTSLATIYGTSETLDVSGGWHDAGDYGRYVKTGTKTLTDLLLAYLRNPSLFSDDTGTNYSGDGVADLLEEMRVELDWLFKMQRADGSVYAKVITQGIPGEILPEEDNQPLFVLPVKSTSTGSFAGTMALAFLVYQNTDPDYAKQCLEAAKLAYSYLQNHPEIVDDQNPEDVTGGDYRDEQDCDERYYAAMALWCATQENTYLQDAEAMIQADAICATGTSWKDVGAYGSYLYLVYSTDTSSSLYQTVLKTLVAEGDAAVSLAASSGYQVSLASFDWGSNGFAANAGILLSMAADIANNNAYEQAATENLNYLLGKNALNMSFVSGYGTTFPIHPHSRIAEAKGAFLVGALVGGPDSAREDPTLQALPADLPVAKTYADAFESYASNEIAIYWNGALIHLIAALTN